MSTKKIKQLQQNNLVTKIRKQPQVIKDTVNNQLPKLKKIQTSNDKALAVLQNCSNLIKFIRYKANEHQERARFRFQMKISKSSKKLKRKLNQSLPELEKDNLFESKNLIVQNANQNFTFEKQTFSEPEKRWKTKRLNSDLRNSVDVSPSEIFQNQHIRLKHFKESSQRHSIQLNAALNQKNLKKISRYVPKSFNPNLSIYEPPKKLRIPFQSKFQPLQNTKTEEPEVIQQKSKQEQKKI